MSEEMVEVSVEILAVTDGGYKVTDSSVTCWLPRSKIQDDPHASKGAELDITIPVWLATNEGLV